MKQFVGGILVLFLFCKLNAQSLDTNSAFFTDLYGLYKQTPTFFSAFSVENFTVSSVFFNTEKGAFYLGQESERKTNFGIATNGFYKNQHSYFFGRIRVQRDYEYGKKWNLSYAEVQPNGIMENPHYCAVSQGADWINQRYKVEGSYNFSLWQKKVNSSLFCSYNFIEKYRTEYDPRPKIKQNKIKVASHWGFNLNKQNKIDLGISYGRMGVDNSILFSDVSSQNNLNYHKLLKWQLGYGTFQLPSNPSTKHQQGSVDFSLGYHLRTEKNRYLFSSFYRNSNTETFVNNRQTNIANKVIAEYFSNLYRFCFNHLHTVSAQKYWNFRTCFLRENNFNKLQAQNGKTYQAKIDVLNFRLSFFEKKQNLLNREFFFLGSYQSAIQKDALSQTSRNREVVFANLGVSQDYPFSKMIINPLFSIKYSYVIRHNFQSKNSNYNFPATSNEYAKRNIQLFYDEVVLRDNELLKLNYYSFNLGLNFKKKITDKKILLFGGKFEYKTLLKNKDRYYFSSYLSLAY